jgi:hypothetical protein
MTPLDLAKQRVEKTYAELVKAGNDKNKIQTLAQAHANAQLKYIEAKEREK